MAKAPRKKPKRKSQPRGRNRGSFKVKGSRKVKEFFNTMPKTTVKVSGDWVRKEARGLRDELKRAIRKQEFDWVALSPAYAAMKKREGLDSRIYIAEGAYLNAIVVRRRPLRDKVVFTVGVLPGRHYSGLTYVALARIHEFGSRKANIPARPLWRPIWSRWVRKAPQKLKNLSQRIKKGR